MRRSLTAVVISLALLVSVISIPSQPTGAQESAATAKAIEGVTIESVTGTLVPPLVAEGADVRLQRAHFEPGAAFSIAAEDAATLLVTVETATLTVRSSAPLVIGRAGTGTTATMSQRWVAADSDIILERGDSFVRPPHSEQELRNAGQEPSTALLASIVGAPDAATASAPAFHGGGLVVALAVVVVPECEEGYEPVEVAPAATPGGGGGGGGAGGVAVAIAAAPECVGGTNAGQEPLSASTPVP